MREEPEGGLALFAVDVGVAFVGATAAALPAEPLAAPLDALFLKRREKDSDLSTPPLGFPEPTASLISS